VRNLDLSLGDNEEKKRGDKKLESLLFFITAIRNLIKFLKSDFHQSWMDHDEKDDNIKLKKKRSFDQMNQS